MSSHIPYPVGRMEAPNVAPALSPLLDKQGRFAQAAPQRARAEMRAQIPDLP